MPKSKCQNSKMEDFWVKNPKIKNPWKWTKLNDLDLDPWEQFLSIKNSFQKSKKFAQKLKGPKCQNFEYFGPKI